MKRISLISINIDNGHCQKVSVYAKCSALSPLDDNGRCGRLQQQADKLSQDIVKLRNRQGNRQRELDSVSLLQFYFNFTMGNKYLTKLVGSGSVTVHV